jgi:hypothetical protein
MIIVFEGISSAGKTTRASRYAPAVVDEVTGLTPPEDVAAAGQYWSDRNSERWQRGLELERTHEIVCFDTDPLKIHYTWCLWQIGKDLRYAWLANVKATREQIAKKHLGFADQIAFLEPSEDVIRRQKDDDRVRRRSNFETHVRLYEPLRRWYVLLESLAPGRVVFNAHQTPDSTPKCLRTDRYDLQLFDALIEGADRPVGYRQR